MKMACYAGWLPIEHQHVLLNSLERLVKYIAVLQGDMPALLEYTTGRLQTTGSLSPVVGPLLGIIDFAPQ